MKTDKSLHVYTDTSYQVWVETPAGGVFMFRDKLIYAVAQNWARDFTAEEAGLPPGTKFFPVQAVTTYNRML